MSANNPRWPLQSSGPIRAYDVDVAEGTIRTADDVPLRYRLPNLVNRGLEDGVEDAIIEALIERTRTKAIAEERERCAKVADAIAAHHKVVFAPFAFGTAVADRRENPAPKPPETQA